MAWSSTTFTVANVSIYAFLDFLLPVIQTIFCPFHWLLSHMTIIETVTSSMIETNSITMIITNPSKEIDCGSLLVW